MKPKRHPRRAAPKPRDGWKAVEEWARSTDLDELRRKITDPDFRRESIHRMADAAISGGVLMEDLFVLKTILNENALLSRQFELVRSVILPVYRERVPGKEAFKRINKSSIRVRTRSGAVIIREPFIDAELDRIRQLHQECKPRFPNSPDRLQREIADLMSTPKRPYKPRRVRHALKKLGLS